MNDLKVALISEEFPPFAFGGIASNCYDLAYSLSIKQIPTTVFCGRSKEVAVRKPNDYLTVIYLPYLNLPPRFLWFQLQNLSLLLKLLKKHTVLHGINPLAATVCAYFKKRLRKPLVTSIHGVLVSNLKAFITSPISSWSAGEFGLSVVEYPLKEFLFKACLTRSDYVIAHGSHTFYEMNRIYPKAKRKRVSVINNGIRFGEIDRMINDENERDSSTKSKSGVTLVFFGRLLWMKGLIHLVKAFDLLVEEFPNMNLKIFGKGPLDKKIRMLISSLDLENRIHVLGHLPRRKLMLEIKKADLVILPSIHEAQPIAPLEAMACKKPVVAFDFPFAREYIKDSYNGLLAEAEDLQDLADRIRILLSDKELRLRLGQNGYKYVKENHNWDSLVDKYIEIYEGLT